MKKCVPILLLLVVWIQLFSGCGVAVRGIGKGFTAIKNSCLFHQGRHGELSKEEKKWAKIAWIYFENNYNPKTGLVNSVDMYPSTTMWHTADYLAALMAARELELIKPCEFDERLSTLLDFLNTMDLFFGKLPNKVYNTQTGKMVDYGNQPQEIGWSALDIGRLLIWLAIIKCHYPIYAEYIDKVVLRWNFCDLIDNCGTLYGGIKVHNKIQLYQEGRMGYEEYAAKGFQLWGFNTTRASRIAPVEKVKIYDIEIPYDSRDPRKTGTYSPVLSMGFLLDGLEFNWDRTEDQAGLDSHHSDPITAGIAERIYLVQEARYRRENIFTARTDHQVSGPPYFVYDSIFAAGYPWNVISDSGEYHEEQALVSTRAAFGMWGLWKTDYTDCLIKVVECLNDPTKGWYEGRREKTGGYMKTVTGGTNSAVLETLLYKVKGKLLSNRGSSGCKCDNEYIKLWTTDPFREQGKCFPLERKGCLEQISK